MKRTYETGTSNVVKLFTGREIEHTPAYNMETLFVVGLQDIETVRQTAADAGVEHIYLGANMSYYAHEDWDEIVLTLLKEGWWVTLDFDIRDVEYVLESGYTEYNRFIPMISAKLPYIDQLGYNACLKIDDKDFDASNPGVWVHRVHDLKDKTVFTDWSKYTKDKVLK
jgi:hypothetical protein